jgi:hypothetical protein
VTDTPTFIDHEISAISVGHYAAESDNPIGIFLEVNLGDDPCVFLSKKELYELLSFIEEREPNGA